MPLGGGLMPVLAAKTTIAVLDTTAAVGGTNELELYTAQPGELVVVAASDWMGTAGVTATLDGAPMAVTAAYEANPSTDFIRTALFTGIAGAAGYHVVVAHGLSAATTGGPMYRFVQAATLTGGPRGITSTSAATLLYQGSHDTTAASIRVPRPSYLLAFAIYNTGDTGPASFTWTGLPALDGDIHEGNGIDIEMAGARVPAGVTDVTVTASFPGVGGPYTSSLLTLAAI